MVASEACYHLGVPTTRAAALWRRATGTLRDSRATRARLVPARLRRDTAETGRASHHEDTHRLHHKGTYSGAARQERCATIARLAPAWYRPGSVEILQRRAEPATMRTLIDFIIKWRRATGTLCDSRATRDCLVPARLRRDTAETGRASHHEDTHRLHHKGTYSGAARQERCATVARLATAWYRPGSVEILQRRAELATMRTLIDFIIKVRTVAPRDRNAARLAPAWYRPGSVEILQRRAEPATMRTLIDFIIKVRTVAPRDRNAARQSRDSCSPGTGPAPSRYCRDGPS
ncbi:Uncharacterized protein OBRU01_05001 [Operophtera brumata]|uniref:Selenoprotein O n=1 Tax=Operophtera brumata TaxID=104452 RepID=A0A0L7LNT7_OPEBR|nr:Uncharacterized protein OBRU01_05001 [Operophtera brumata]